MNRQAAWAEFYRGRVQSPIWLVGCCDGTVLLARWCCVLPSLGLQRCFAQQFLTNHSMHLIRADVREAKRVQT